MDILCEIVPYASSIAEDEELIKTLKNKIEYDEDKKEEIKQKGFELGMANLFKLIPIIFKDHKKDVQMILAIVDNKTLEEIQQENIFKNISRIKEIFEDEELIVFFQSLNKLEALK